MSGQAKVVALLGVSGSGKTLTARRLLQDFKFQRLRFSDPQRDMLRAGFGLADHDIDGPGWNKPQARFGGHTIMTLMQTLAHEWGRDELHSDIWVNEWRRRLESMTGYVVAEDLQRANEAAAVREAGGIIVRITRPGYIPSQTASFHRQARIVHDVELINEGPDKLVQLVDQFVRSLDAALVA